MDARDILPSYGMPLLPVFNTTVAMSGFHRTLKKGEGMDCTHYCHPSGPQMAVAALIQVLKEARLPAPAPMSDKKGAWGKAEIEGIMQSVQVVQRLRKKRRVR